MHLFVSAAHKSSGKTTLSVGLCAALAARGQRVQPFKKGPDYIDPIWLGLAAGRPCYNLDFHTMNEGEIRATFARRCEGSDLALIEGNEGLFDGVALDGADSNAALALALGTPVLLVVDTRGMTRGIAPLVLGYRAFDPRLRIGGVILNHVGGPRHEGKLRRVLEAYTDVPVLGAVARQAALEIPEQHLGLVPGTEHPEAQAVIGRLARAVCEQVDLERVVDLARSAPAVDATPLPSVAPPRPDVCVAVARDAAFGFYYADDLEALAGAGARLVYFDALRDQALPACDGIVIGGGFPERAMEALSANRGLRRELREAIQSGMPVYAECGGLMYLGRSLRWADRRAEMVGALPFDVRMHARPQGRGLVRLAETGAGPWPVLRDGTEIHGHEFHHSSVEELGEDVRFAYRMLRGHGVDGQHDGLVYRNVLASYSHLRDTERFSWTRRFVDFVRRCRRDRARAAAF